MFSNIGEKIKTLAKVVCWIGIVASFGGGIAILVNSKGRSGVLIFLGFMTMVVGSLLSWIGSFFIYGFGELIERTASADEQLKYMTKQNEGGITVRTLAEKAEEDAKLRREEDERQRREQDEKNAKLRRDQEAIAEKLRRDQEQKAEKERILAGIAETNINEQPEADDTVSEIAGAESKVGDESRTGPVLTKNSDFKLVPMMQCDLCDKKGVPLASFSFNDNGQHKVIWFCKDCAKKYHAS